MVKTREYGNKPEFHQKGQKELKKKGYVKVTQEIQAKQKAKQEEEKAKQEARQKEEKARQEEEKKKFQQNYAEDVFQFCKEVEEEKGIYREEIVKYQLYSAQVKHNAYNSPETKKALEEATLALKMLKTWAMVPSKHSPLVECVHHSLGFVCPWGWNHCPCDAVKFTKKFHEKK